MRIHKLRNQPLLLRTYIISLVSTNLNNVKEWLRYLDK